MKLKTILISQPKPDSEKSPYYDIARNHKVQIDFKPFIHVEGIPGAEFRKQRIDLGDYSCIILNSKNAVDHYFRLANELRYTVPEKNKYFCLTEAVALYLQKYIVYRKRKIFFAQQSIEELAEPIRKNKDEKFLFPCSDKHTDKITEFLDNNKIQYAQGVLYRTVSSDMRTLNVPGYDMICFFSPNGIQSLFDNYPNFKQGTIFIGVFGTATLNAAISKGLRVDLAAPMPHSPSMTMSLDWFLKQLAKNGSAPKPLIPQAKAPEAKETPVKSSGAPKKKATQEKPVPRKPEPKAVKKEAPKATKPSPAKPTAKSAPAKPVKKVAPKAKPAAKKPAAKAPVKKAAVKKAPVKKVVAKAKPKAKTATKPKAKPVAKKAVAKKAAVKPKAKAVAKKTTKKAVAVKGKPKAKARPAAKKPAAKKRR